MARVEAWARTEGCLVLRRKHNGGSVRNITETIRFLEETEDFPAEDVVLLVDGDDRLAHPGVLARLREVYDGTGILMSWGSYRPEPADDGCPPARPLPPDILRFGMVRAFTRDWGQWWNHPISFRRRLFDVLRDDDVTRDGEWMGSGYDTVLGVPLIEAAGELVEFVPDVLYVYRSDCADSVHRTHPETTNAASEWVTGQPRKYHALPDDWYLAPEPEVEVESAG
jgi:glycosyltransferase involved in cell wall biosynthesis